MVHCRDRRRTSLCTSTRAIHGPHTSLQRTALSRPYQAFARVGVNSTLDHIPSCFIIVLSSTRVSVQNQCTLRPISHYRSNFLR